MINLAPQELATLRTMATGLSTKEAAQVMGLSCHTVKSYAGSVRKKFGLSAMTAVILKAERMGLLEGVEV